MKTIQGLLMLFTSIIHLFLINVEADFRLTVKFINYTNPSGLCAECNTRLEDTPLNDIVPVCCDEMKLQTDNCNNVGESRCDTRFRWILREYGASLETRPGSLMSPGQQVYYYFSPCGQSFAMCPFSEMSRTFEEGDIAFLGRSNPFLVNSTNPWTGRIQFFIEPIETALPNIIDSFLINLDTLQLGADFTEEMTYTGYHNISQMRMSFKVKCAPNYCGPDCDVSSLTNPSISNCESNGEVICINDKLDPSQQCTTCLPGYPGEDCLADCVYEYTRQPPNEISCNPYGDGDTELNLSCALTAPVGSSVTINWFRNNSGQINTGIQSSTESGNTGVDTFNSVLSLSNPNPSDDSGDYFCQGFVNDMNLLPSDAFPLDSNIMTYINYSPCDDTTMASIDQFKTETKCADVTLTEIPTIVLVTTQPTTVHPPPVQPTTNNNPSTTDPQAIPEDQQVWIYILVGVVAMFGMIIVILTIMFVGLYLKRNKSVDSETRPPDIDMKQNIVYGVTQSTRPSQPATDDIELQPNALYGVRMQSGPDTGDQTTYVNEGLGPRAAEDQTNEYEYIQI